MGNRFIVTGGAGFIGSNIVAALNARGEEDILIVDHMDHPAKQFYLDQLRYRKFMDKVEFREDLLAGKQDPVTTIFHLGACSSTTETNEAYLRDNNYQYTQDLCAWCLEHDVRFVYASSAATYGDGSLGYSDADAVTPTLKPLNLYGESKQQFDQWALDNGVLDRIVGLKYFNVYGPQEDHKGTMRSLVNKAYSQIQETGKIRLFRSHRPEYADGEQERDFVYVRDAVAVTLFFHDHPEHSGLFNCGTGQARSWVALARALFAAMGREANIEFIDMPLEIRDKYQYHTQADVSKLRAVGYDAAFTSVEDAVADYVKTYLATPRFQLQKEAS